MLQCCISKSKIYVSLTSYDSIILSTHYRIQLKYFYVKIVFIFEKYISLQNNSIKIHNTLYTHTYIIHTNIDIYVYLIMRNFIQIQIS